MINLPNTTPVPNEIINGWVKKLKGSELKVLIIVTRKTLGWIVDPETGMRKEEDWISYSQLGEATGLASEALSKAIDNLCGKYELIQIRDENGNPMDTKDKRRLAGKRRLKLFYRLNLATLKETSHYFEKQSSDNEAENRSSSASENEAALLRKPKTTKSTLTKSTLTKEKALTIQPSKYPSLISITETEFQQVAQDYQVPLPFVRNCYDSLVNYCDAHGKRYKNYLAALRNFVKSDALKIRKEASDHVSKQGIDARGIK